MVKKLHVSLLGHFYISVWRLMKLPRNVDILIWKRPFAIRILHIANQTDHHIS